MIHNSIVAGNTGEIQCNGTWTNTAYSIDGDGTCNFDTGSGNQKMVDPLLGPLADNGGPTHTYLPGTGSPAIDTGDPASCPGPDQRGLPRPALGGCDIGAVEMQPPAAATTSAPAAVVERPDVDQRRSRERDAQARRRQHGDGDGQARARPLAAGTPVRWTITGVNPGTGTGTTDANGQVKISWDGVHDGADTLMVFWDRNANGAFDFGEPAGTATVNWVLPAPVIAKTVNIEPIQGTVLIKLPKANGSKVAAAASGFIPLDEAKNVPIGTIVDATRGRMELTTAVAKNNTKTQSGQFYSGQFQMGQQKNSPYMELTLNQPLSCAPVSSAAKKPKSRSLWGSDKGGKFRTRGRHSVATVRGTTWFTKDACTTTTTVVREGTVVVKDLAKHKNVTVKAGKRYVAHAAKKKKRK